MSNMPPLPATSWCGLVHAGGPYEPEWTSNQDGYTDEHMHTYACEYAAAVQEKYDFLLGLFSPMSLNIDGNHTWAFRGGGVLERGPNMDQAVINSLNKQKKA